MIMPQALFQFTYSALQIVLRDELFGEQFDVTDSHFPIVSE